MKKLQISPDESSLKETLFLNGLRAVGVLMVMLHHMHIRPLELEIAEVIPYNQELVQAIFLQGYSGVTLFFVISAFLLFQPYLRHLLYDEERPSTRLFLVRRFFRTAPAYFFSLIIFLPWLSRGFLLPQNWYKILPMLTLVGMDAVTDNVNASYWSLAVEWQFYLALPVVCLLMSYLVGKVELRARKIRLLYLLMSSLVLMTLLHAFNYYYVMWNLREQVPLPGWLMDINIFLFYGKVGFKRYQSFLVGMLAAYIYVLAKEALARDDEARWNLGRQLQRSWGWLVGLGVTQAVLMTLWGFYHRMEWHSIPVLEALSPFYLALHELGMATAFGLCIIGLAFGPEKARRPLEWPPMLFIGMISYTMYLWNQPIVENWLVYWEKYMHLPRGPLAFLSLYPLMVIFIFACWGLYKCIEEPGSKYGYRLVHRLREKFAERESASEKKPQLPFAKPARMSQPDAAEKLAALRSQRLKV